MLKRLQKNFVNPKFRLLILTLCRLLAQIVFCVVAGGIFTLVFANLRSLFLAVSGAGEATTLSGLWWLVVVLPVTLLAGRFFCGWMCAYGTASDLLYLLQSKTLKKTVQIPEKADAILKKAKYAVLVAIVVFSWQLRLPLAAANPWDAFGQLFDMRYIFDAYLPGFIVMLLTLLPALFIERFFCRYLCPLGAVFSIFAKGRQVKLKKEPQLCGSCKLCTKNCPMQINLQNQAEVKSGECVNCMNCVAVCPKKNMHYTVAGSALKPLATASACVGIICCLYAVPLLQGYTAMNLDADVRLPVPLSGEVGTEQEAFIPEPGPFTDGTYIGTGRGYKPGLNVEIVIENGWITAVNLGKNKEDALYLNKAVAIVAEIIAKQSTDEVDAVTGCTKSCDGIKQAVDDALSQAGE